MSNRITARDGNVVTADFGQQFKFNITLQVLYADPAVCLARLTYLLNGQPFYAQHILAETPAS